jgi:flagellar biosynthesis/type III secretory pathway protein FliH
MAAREPSNVLASLREQFAAELKALRDEARQQGIAAARQEAEAALRKAIQQEREHLMALVTAVRAQHEQMIPELEPVVVRLALMVVTKLLGQHQAARPLVADLAIQAIEAYRLGTLVQISVAPADHARIQAQEIASELFQHLQIDHELAPGSCLIDYGRGQLDVSLATQWATLQTMMLQAASGAGHVVST